MIHLTDRTASSQEVTRTFCGIARQANMRQSGKPSVEDFLDIVQTTMDPTTADCPECLHRDSDIGWIGVDFDGTVAVYDGWHGPAHVGAPIPAMVQRVRGWLAAGRRVKIFTARMDFKGSDNLHARRAIEGFCWEQFGRLLEITNVKDLDCMEIWDDRAIQVKMNTGERVGSWENPPHIPGAAGRVAPVEDAA